MKVKIVIQTMKSGVAGIQRSEVWSGEMEILDENEYLIKMSLITDGKPEPIVDMPFAIGVGHYMWIPPKTEYESIDEGWEMV